MAAAALASVRASTLGTPEMRAKARAAQKASPAPVVSTALTLKALTWKEPVSLTRSEPLLPSVMTAALAPDLTMALPALTASPTYLIFMPMSWDASTSLGTT